MGSLPIPALWPFAEGLFLFYKLFSSKEGFVFRIVVFNKKA